MMLGGVEGDGALMPLGCFPLIAVNDTVMTLALEMVLEALCHLLSLGVVPQPVSRTPRPVPGIPHMSGHLRVSLEVLFVPTIRVMGLKVFPGMIVRL